MLSLVIFWAMHKLNLGYFKLTEIALGRIPSFLVGCLFGKWVYEKKVIDGAWRWPIALAVGLFYVFRDPETPLHWWTRCLYPMGGVLALLAFAALLSAVDSYQHQSKSDGSHPIWKFIRKSGDLSLELYLGSAALLAVLREMSVPFLTFTAGDSVWVRAMISLAFIIATYAVAFLARACTDAMTQLKTKHTNTAKEG